MPAHFDKFHSHHNAKDVFDIVADVESYPEFLPWIERTKIIERGDGFFIAEMVANFKGFKQGYVSKVEMLRPEENDGNWEIDVSLVRGPFKYLKTNWIFVPKNNDLSADECEIVFKLDFKFDSMILERMIGFLFERAVLKMTKAFEARADELLSKK